MKTTELIKLIKPESDKEKYSQNLFRWLRKNRNVPVFAAFSPLSFVDENMTTERDTSKTQCSHIYIGVGDLDQGWLHGARLSEIITNGTKAQSWAHPPNRKFVILKDWFEQYIKQGKCFIDPEHIFYHERWDEVDTERSCKWCDRKEAKYIEMVPKESWVLVTARQQEWLCSQTVHLSCSN